MYRAWAHERGMRLDVVEARDDRSRNGLVSLGGVAQGAPPPAASQERTFRFVASVSGFAALRTLAPEDGLHVLEIPDGRGGYDRRRVRVTVTAEGADEPAAARATIVRRYRERPTPLVRDAVRGWRTGRLESVLSGGFDLIE